VKASAHIADTREDDVLIDHRYYHVKPGTTPAYLDLYEKNGLKPQSRHLGQPYAYLFTESGDMNAIIHLWAYDSAADRERKRAGMMADPEWQKYVKMLGESGYLVDMKTSLMVPAGFAPIKR
jgi:hypothetical protein